jgi:hypothetical protein
MTIALVLLASAVVLTLMDRALGLGFVLTGFGVLAFLASVMLVLGLNGDLVQELLMVLAPFIFILIIVRLARSGPLAKDHDSTLASSNGDRNALRILGFLEVGNNVLQKFIFHLAFATLLISFSTTVASFSVAQQPVYAGIHPACAFLTNRIAARCGATGIWQVFWAAIGLFFVGTTIHFLAIALNDWIFNDGVLLSIFANWVSGKIGS